MSSQIVVMSPEMSDEMLLPNETLFAQLASVGTTSICPPGGGRRMRSLLMPVSVRDVLECFSAVSARIRLDTGVNARVSLQIVLQEKLFATLLTLVIPLLQMVTRYMNLSVSE